MIWSRSRAAYSNSSIRLASFISFSSRAMVSARSRSVSFFRLSWDASSVDVYDLAHYPDMQKKYNIMSVPCLIMDEKTYFGKKSLEEILGILGA